MTAALGTRFVDALATSDRERLEAVLHPDVDFRGLTPNRVWEAADAEAALEIVLGNWFEASDEIDELVLVESDTFADREQLRFRLRGHNGDGPFVVEQQAYIAGRSHRVDARPPLGIPHAGLSGAGPVDAAVSARRGRPRRRAGRSAR